VLIQALPISIPMGCSWRPTSRCSLARRCCSCRGSPAYRDHAGALHPGVPRFAGLSGSRRRASPRRERSKRPAQSGSPTAVISAGHRRSASRRSGATNLAIRSCRRSGSAKGPRPDGTPACRHSRQRRCNSRQRREAASRRQGQACGARRSSSGSPRRIRGTARLPPRHPKRRSGRSDSLMSPRPRLVQVVSPDGV
jgi:hypothetical protein